MGTGGRGLGPLHPGQQGGVNRFIGHVQGQGAIGPETVGPQPGIDESAQGTWSPGQVRTGEDPSLSANRTLPQNPVHQEQKRGPGPEAAGNRALDVQTRADQGEGKDRSLVHKAD